MPCHALSCFLWACFLSEPPSSCGRRLLAGCVLGTQPGSTREGGSSEDRRLCPTVSLEQVNAPSWAGGLKLSAGDKGGCVDTSRTPADSACPSTTEKARVEARETQAFVGDWLLRGGALGQILPPGTLAWNQSSTSCLSSKIPPGAALPAAASRGASSSPHPSDAILDARLRLRVTIRIPEFMPGAINYTPPWPRGPATSSTRSRNYSSQRALRR